MTISCVDSVCDLTQSVKKSELDTPKRKNVDIEEALDETGFGRYNFYLILTSGLLLFATNSETYGVGFIVPAAECELNLDSYTKGILASAHFYGIVASSAVWGYLSDIKGRRRLLIFNLVSAFVSGVVAAVTPSFWGFTVLRAINGICISCPGSICFVYLGEFLCTKTRSKSMACASAFVALALITLPALGWLLLQTTFTARFLGLGLNSWRTFMLINSVPSLVAALCLSKLPESPKYLYCSGKPQEALKVLREIYSSNTGYPEEAFPVQSLNEKIYLEKSSSGKKNAFQDFCDQIVPLFKAPLLAYTLAGCLMEAGLFAVSSGLFVWYPDIVNQISKSGKGSVTICEALSSGFDKENNVRCDGIVEDRVFILNIIVGLYYLVAYATWGVVVKLLRTRNFFIICIAISTLSTALLCFLSSKIFIDIFFITALCLSGIGVSILNAWIVEIFPTHIAGMALCTTMTAGRLGGVVSSSIAGILLEWNCLTTFGLYALNLIVCLVLSLLLPQNR